MSFTVSLLLILVFSNFYTVGFELGLLELKARTLTTWPRPPRLITIIRLIRKCTYAKSHTLGSSFCLCCLLFPIKNLFQPETGIKLPSVFGQNRSLNFCPNGTVVVVKRSECLPSTPTIGVLILAKSTFSFSKRLFEKNQKWLLKAFVPKDNCF